MDKKGLYQIEAIQSEYRRIDREWLQKQYQLMLWLVVVATAAELLMAVLLQNLDVVSSNMQTYFLKYLLTPFACNLLLVLAATFVMRCKCMMDRKKIYAVSMLLALMAFVIYTVHAVFEPLFVVFTIPVVLTVIYGDYFLTGLTSAACVAGKLVSDLFVVWDPDRVDVLANSNNCVNFILSTGFLVLFCCTCYFLITAEREKNGVSIHLEQERQRYREEAVTDQLTRVGNRQALRQAFLEMEAAPAERQFFLAMLDLDDFKGLNDTYGHSGGDQYLQALGEVMLGLKTDGIQPFRFGGDEFCILFCGYAVEAVQEICRELQKNFADKRVHQTYRPITVSIGVAEYRYGERPVHLLDRADAALYRAKLEKGCIQLEH